jgi:hypothetical protein
MKTEKNQPKQVMEQLVEQAQWEKMSGLTRGAKPGDMITRLGYIKRKILEDLKPEDITDVRWMK